MTPSKNRLEQEYRAIKTMIRMYCKKFHYYEKGLCQECCALLKYAEQRLNNCKFGENKPTCDTCSIHCYKSEMRGNIREACVIPVLG